jgi:hypothetical protein
MSGQENMKKIYEQAKLYTLAGKDKTVLKKMKEIYLHESKAESKPVELSIWRIIMKNNITKYAAVFVVLLIIFGAVSIFTNSNIPLTSVAFSEVISQIRNSNYTFDLKVLLDNNGEKVEGVTNHAKFLQPGLLRLDAPELSVCTITDFNTGRSILLWHDRKTVQIISENAQNLVVEESPFNILTSPIEQLWNLQDGNEIELGEKQIDGQMAYGFEIQERNELISYNMIVWADSQTGNPIQIEIHSFDPDNPEESAKMTFIMNNFNMNAELDPANFSMDIPEGYKQDNSNNR